jgi:hypothetical protein
VPLQKELNLKVVNETKNGFLKAIRVDNVPSYRFQQLSKTVLLATCDFHKLFPKSFKLIGIELENKNVFL